MKFGWLKGLMLISLGAAQGVQAQPIIRKPAKPPTATEVKDALLEVNGFARCVAKRRKASAEAMLALPYLTPEQADAARKLTDGLGTCIHMRDSQTVTLTFDPALLAAGVAEYFITSDYDASDVALLAELTEPQLSAQDIAPRNGLEAFGQCVLMQDPASVYALVNTKPTSSEVILPSSSVSLDVLTMPPC